MTPIRLNKGFNRLLLLPVIAGTAFVLFSGAKVSEEVKYSVKVYPNPSPNGTVNIEVEGNAGDQIQFYVFELDGTMKHSLNMKGNEKKTIQGLETGMYTYDAFLKDEGVAQGRIIVK